jgi:hypothetical protein
MSYTYPHISLLNTTTQTIASANTPQVVTFNTVVRNDKITVTSTSRYTFKEGGDYLLSSAVQYTSTSGTRVLDMWFRVNGTDVANTNKKLAVKASNDVGVVPLAGIIVTVTAGQYIEMWMSADSTDVSLPAYVAGTTPTRPVTPSLFMTIIKIHP